MKINNNITIFFCCFFNNIMFIILLLKSGIAMGQNIICINDSTQIMNDSLILIKSDSFSIYPFGENQICDSTLRFFEQNKFQLIERKVNSESFRFIFKRDMENFILFLEGEEGYYEIIKAKIKSNTFYKIYFRDKPILIGAEINSIIHILAPDLFLSKNKISTIHIKSALTGVDQYYKFKSGRLFEIKIDSDYVFSNDIDEIFAN